MKIKLNMMKNLSMYNIANIISEEEIIVLENKVFIKRKLTKSEVSLFNSEYNKRVYKMKNRS